jgi:hypothetical protein
MKIEDSKCSAPAMADEKGVHRTLTAVSDNGTARVGSMTEINDLTQLGYKPEMVRNRSMLTLLFQSLAIAAIRMSGAWVSFVGVAVLISCSVWRG